MGVVVTKNNSSLLVEPKVSLLNLSSDRNSVTVESASNNATVIHSTNDIAVNTTYKSVSVDVPSNTVVIQSNFNIGAVEALVKDLIPSMSESIAIAKVEMLVIQFDSLKQTHFVITSSVVEGDLISLLILLDGDSVEVFGNYNFIGNRVEFQTDFSAVGLTARVTYIKK